MDFCVTSLVLSVFIAWIIPLFSERLHFPTSRRTQGPSSGNAQFPRPPSDKFNQQNASIYLGWGKQKWSTPKRSMFPLCNLCHLICTAKWLRISITKFIWNSKVLFKEGKKKSLKSHLLLKHCLLRLFQNTLPEIQVAEKHCNRHYPLAVEGCHIRKAKKPVFCQALHLLKS